MKKFSIVLNVVLVLVSLFFVAFAMIKQDEAILKEEISYELRHEVDKLSEHAFQDASKAREAEAVALRAKRELEECKKLNQ